MCGHDPLFRREFELDFIRAACWLLRRRKITLRKLIALLLHSEGFPYAEIAWVLEVDKTAVSRWRKQCSQALADSGYLDGYDEA